MEWAKSPTHENQLGPICQKPDTLPVAFRVIKGR